jgi:hypothetical protein
MPPSNRSHAASRRAPGATGDEPRRSVVGVAIAAWLMPGAAHLLLGEARKAVIFWVALLVMFGMGLAFGGRLFPFAVDDPLVFLEAVAEWTIGLPRIVAGLAGFGAGHVTTPAYEYGNTFLVVAGLLNALVILDAVDLASGRKRS